MFLKNLTRAACFAAMLVALVISAGQVFGQTPIPWARISVASDTPPSSIFPIGSKGVATKIEIEVGGESEPAVYFEGVTIGEKGLSADSDFEEVSFWLLWPTGDVRIGYGKLQDGKLQLDLTPYISHPLVTGKYYFEIRFQLSEYATPGATFALGIVDVYMPDCIVAMPVGGAFGNVMTISSPVEIGSLKVSAAPTEIPIYFPPISRAFLAEFQFEASLKEDIEMRELTVGFSAPGCEEWLDNFGLIDPASGMWIFGPVQVQAASPILLQGIFEIPKGEIRTLTAIADIEENAPGTRFNLSIFEIQARGLVFGFDVPVYGLPCTGPDVWLMVFPEFPSFYGWIRDLKTGNPIENVLIIAIREESKKRIKALSDSNGYYIFEDLEPGVYWLIAAQQGYRLNIQPALAEEGESTQIDFWLKSKK